MYMQRYVEKFNLSKHKKPIEYEQSDRFGFYDGQDFVVTQSRYELLTYFEMWWRYGWDIVNLGTSVVNPLLSNFKRVYSLQADGETFDDIHNFLASLDPDFPQLLNISIKDYMLSHGFSNCFIDEFVFIATNVNYNQNTDIHGFVGAVALAGAQDGLWSVQGGNKLVPQALLKHSDARLIMQPVRSIELLPDSKFAIQVDDHTQIYDYIIIAFPIIPGTKYDINFKGFPNHISVPVKYQKIVVTLVHGELNHTYFHLTSPKDLPNHIFSVNNTLFFNSVSVLDPVIPDKTYDRKVFKVFSKEKLTENQLNNLFLTYDNVSPGDWLAYPKYDTQSRNLSFWLHNNLLYANTMEWAASAMEMSAVSGVNSALHILKKHIQN